MCGIFGIIGMSGKPISIKQLKEMMKRRDRDSKKKVMGDPDTVFFV